MICQVNVPVHILLALVDRVLMVNGSLPQMAMPFVTAKQQENICSELPVLHSYGLELLTTVVKGVGRYACMILFYSRTMKRIRCSAPYDMNEMLIFLEPYSHLLACLVFLEFSFFV